MVSRYVRRRIRGAAVGHDDFERAFAIREGSPDARDAPADAARLVPCSYAHREAGEAVRDSVGRNCPAALLHSVAPVPHTRAPVPDRRSGVVSESIRSCIVASMYWAAFLQAVPWRALITIGRGDGAARFLARFDSEG